MDIHGFHFYEDEDDEEDDEEDQDEDEYEDEDDEEDDDNLRQAAEVPVKVRHCQPSKGDVCRYTPAPKSLIKKGKM